MRHPPGGRSVLHLCTAVGIVIATGVSERTVSAGATTVALLAPAGSRLADELRRELEISAFPVVVVVEVAVADRSAIDDWQDIARELVGAERPRVVAVRADERQVIVLSRSSNAGGVQASFALQLDPDDRPTRRRACLTVVEYLRVLGEDQDRTPSQPPGAAPKEASDAPVPIPIAADVIDDESSETGADEPSLSARPSRAQPWTMGVGTTLDLSLKGGQTAGHLQFIWVFPLGPRLSVRALAQWPVLGADFRASGADVRMWTFGAAFGLQYSFTESPARWRPFLGLAVGNRIALTEASSGDPLQSRSSVTPSANLGLNGGIRYALGPLVQLFSELEIARDWMVPTANRMDYEKAEANAVSFHTSVGVLFEY